jgi:apolipoprotein N-acyltransferase
MLGQPLVDLPPVARVAALGGPEILSFLAAAVSVWLALLFRKSSSGSRWAGFVQGPLAAILAMAAVALVPAGGHNSAGTLRVGLVQPNIRQLDKWDDGKREATLSRLNVLVDRAAALGADVIILPETAVPGFVRYDSELGDFVKNAVARTLKPLLFGSLDRSDDAKEFYNVAALVTPYNTVTFYRKQRLVPITESALSLPWIGRLLDRNGPPDFTPGAERTQFQLLPQRLRFGAVICLEDMFPELARDSARGGADFMVALVNTEPFDKTPEPLQHLRRARLSAIAAGVTLIRATNSGISAVIDSDGVVLQAMPMQKEDGGDVMAVDVKCGAMPTLYDAIGDWPAPGVAGVFFVLAYGGMFAARYRRRPRESRRAARSAYRGETYPTS